jgi:hypothetical protein
MGSALACALVLAPAPRAWAQAALSAGLFLASEPLLVLLGRRGAVPGRSRAARRLAALLALSAAAGAAAWLGAGLDRLVFLAPPALLGAALFGLFLARRERTAAGELLGSWTFAAAALPVAAAGGAPAPAGAVLALFLAALFSLGTAVVHGHLLALRLAAGRRAGAWLPRLAAFLMGTALSAGSRCLAAPARLPGAAFLALLPMTLAALGVWLFPPAPRRLKALGWTAASCTLVGGMLAAALLR